jgi:uncharacterized protein DUF4242
MPSYCLELYLPRGSLARVEAAADQARLAAQELSRSGVPIRYVRTTFLEEDETCFQLFEADSADDVAEAARRAGLQSGRIMLAVEAAAAGAPDHRTRGGRRRPQLRKE